MNDEEEFNFNTDNLIAFDGASEHWNDESFEYSREDVVATFNQMAGGLQFHEGGSILAQVAVFGEELQEFNEALSDYVTDQNDETRKQLIKEWADVQVTLSNFSWFFNFDGEEAFLRVAESNMSKVSDAGLIEKNEAGKILKGPNYLAPDMGGL